MMKANSDKQHIRPRDLLFDIEPLIAEIGDLNILLNRMADSLDNEPDKNALFVLSQEIDRRVNILRDAHTTLFDMVVRGEKGGAS